MFRISCWFCSRVRKWRRWIGGDGELLAGGGGLSSSEPWSDIVSECVSCRVGKMRLDKSVSKDQTR